MVASRLSFKLKNGIKLKDKEYINRIFKFGRKKLQKYSIIFYLESCQFRFLVSFKKRLLNPAKRNAVKRRIKEYIRLNQHRVKKIDCAILITRIPPSTDHLFRELDFIIENENFK